MPRAAKETNVLQLNPLIMIVNETAKKPVEGFHSVLESLPVGKAKNHLLVVCQQVI